MVINPKGLKEHGITVRVFKIMSNGERAPLKHVTPVDITDLSIEIFPENGRALPEVVTNVIKDTVNTPEYADVIVSGLHRTIQTFQILEAIERTNKED